MKVNSIQSYNDNYNSSTNFKGDISIILSKKGKKAIDCATQYATDIVSKYDERTRATKFINTLIAMKNDGTTRKLNFRPCTEEEAYTRVPEGANEWLPAKIRHGDYCFTYGEHRYNVFGNDSSWWVNGIVGIGEELFGKEVIANAKYNETKKFLEELYNVDEMLKKVSESYRAAFDTLLSNK